MSFDVVDGDVVVRDGNGTAFTLDAFGRLRTSQPATVFDFLRRTTAHINLFYSDAVVGGGTVTHQPAQARSRLAVGTASGDKAQHQTRQAMIYQPGKSQLVKQTFNAAAKVTNCHKRIGQFDSNNGIFLDVTAPTVKLVIRSNISGAPVDAEILQTAWNLDKLDGTGPSGKTIDWTKQQLFIFDYEWLGAGSVRFYFKIEGQTIMVHEQAHANLLATSWCRTMNLPLRVEIENTGIATATTLDVSCQTVISEGGHTPEIVPHAADSGVAPKTVNTPLTPLIAVRLKAGEETSVITPQDMDAVSVTSSNFRWAVMLNPIVTGGAVASWQAVTNSSAEFDVARDGVVSGGSVLASGYSAKKASFAGISFDTQIRLGFDLAGVADELMLAVQTLSGNEDYLGAIRWKEAV